MKHEFYTMMKSETPTQNERDGKRKEKVIVAYLSSEYNHSCPHDMESHTSNQKQCMIINYNCCFLLYVLTVTLIIW